MCSIQTIAIPRLGCPGWSHSSSASASVSPPRSRRGAGARDRSPARARARAACGRAGRGSRRGGWRARADRRLEHLDAARRRPPGRAARRRSRAHEHVLEDRHVAERPRAPGARARCPSRQRLAAPARVTSAPSKLDRPAVGAQRAGEHVQERRLAGAVGADDADGIAGPATAKSTPSRTVKRPEALADPTAARIGCRFRRHYDRSYGTSFGVAPGSSGRSGSRRRRIERVLPVPLIHWPPRIGVGTTFGDGPRAPVRATPIGVSTLRVFIALATLALSLGSPLAMSAAAATSKSARLGPSCWFHCLPLGLVAAASCLDVRRRSATTCRARSGAQ